MNQTDLNYTSVIIQDLIAHNFKIHPASKQQKYDDNFVKLLYQCNCSELSIFVTNSRYIWIIFQVQVEYLEDSVSTILEKIIPLNEVVPIVELLLSLDDAIIKKVKGLTEFPTQSTLMLKDFRVNPYQGESNE